MEAEKPPEIKPWLRAFGDDASRHHLGELRTIHPQIRGGPQIGSKQNLLASLSRVFETEEVNLWEIKAMRCRRIKPLIGR